MLLETPQPSTPSPRHTLGFAAIALAATLWAIAAIVASRLFQAGVTPFQLATARAVITAIGLGSVLVLGAATAPPSRRMLASDGSRSDSGWVGQIWRSLRLNWQILALGLSLALVTASYYVAIAHLAVAVALVIQYTAPALVVAIEALRARRLPKTATLISVAAALLGVGLVSGVGNSQLKLDALGLVGAGLSAVFFCSYTLLSQSLVDRYGAMGVMGRGFLVSSLFWLAVQFTQGVPVAVFQVENLPGILFVGIGGTLIPFCLLCWGIQQVRAERGAIAATLEPVVATGLAWLWLGQRLSFSQVMGSILVVGAVAALQIVQASPDPEARL